MSRLKGGLPSIKFRRIRCMFACCSGKIVIQQSEIDGREVPPRPVLQPRKSGKFWRGGAVYRAAKEDGKFQLSRDKIRTWLRQQDT